MCMNQRITLEQLQTYLWNSAVLLRSNKMCIRDRDEVILILEGGVIFLY